MPTVEGEQAHPVELGRRGDEAVARLSPRRCAMRTEEPNRDAGPADRVPARTRAGTRYRPQTGQWPLIPRLKAQEAANDAAYGSVREKAR